MAPGQGHAADAITAQEETRLPQSSMPGSCLQSGATSRKRKAAPYLDALWLSCDHLLQQAQAHLSLHHCRPDPPIPNQPEQRRACTGLAKDRDWRACTGLAEDRDCARGFTNALKLYCEPGRKIQQQTFTKKKSPPPTLKRICNKKEPKSSQSENPHGSGHHCAQLSDRMECSKDKPTPAFLRSASCDGPLHHAPAACHWENPAYAKAQIEGSLAQRILQAGQCVVGDTQNDHPVERLEVDHTSTHALDFLCKEATERSAAKERAQELQLQRQLEIAGMVALERHRAAANKHFKATLTTQIAAKIEAERQREAYYKLASTRMSDHSHWSEFTPTDYWNSQSRVV